MPSDYGPALLEMVASETRLVRWVGDTIGYGRTMQLCEQIWSARLEAQGLPAGGSHAVYCCAQFLQPCPGCAPADARGEHCDWCCGAGRVTKRVAQAIRESEVRNAV